MPNMNIWVPAKDLNYWLQMKKQVPSLSKWLTLKIKEEIRLRSDVEAKSPIVDKKIGVSESIRLTAEESR